VALRSAGQRLAVEAHAVVMLARAGVLGVEPPWRAVARLRGLARYGPVGGPVIHGAARYPERTALVDDLGPISYGELHARSDAIARGWRRRGVGEGSTVGILCRNHRGFVDAALACAKVGARAAYLNYDFGAGQLADVCAREGVELLVHDEEFAAIAPDPPKGRLIAWHDGEPKGQTLRAEITGNAGGPLPPPAGRGSIVLLTSGTTGTPKGAPRQQPRSMAVGGALLSKVPFRAGEATFVAAPMFHALGFLHSQFALALGSTLVVSRRFDAAATLAALAEHRVSALVLVPTLLQRLVTLVEQHPGGDGADGADGLAALRIVFVGGAPLPAELVRRARAALGDVVYNLYGTTEVAWATIATPADLRAAPACAGRPPFGTRVRLYDAGGRRITGPDRPGAIFVGNVLPFEGYTGGGGKRMVDGLLATGDVGHFDGAGRLYVDGRDDDMIVSGGENVFPGEVEQLLATHPAVEEAAVLGVPDPEWGQRLVAFVAPRAGAALTAEQVKEFVRDGLARYKVPREVIFVAALPRNPSGKVLKRELRASL
jgi:fatty-acyl-CoA synthase